MSPFKHVHIIRVKFDKGFWYSMDIEKYAFLLLSSICFDVLMGLQYERPWLKTLKVNLDL